MGSTKGLRPFPKGVSGNPGGRRKTPQHVRDLARTHTEEAIIVLARQMRKGSVIAAKELLHASRQRHPLATLPFVVIIGPLTLLVPSKPVPILSLPWFGLALADGLLVLGAGGLFWLAFRRLGGLLAEDKQRFAGMRLPGIKLLLRYL